MDCVLNKCTLHMTRRPKPLHRHNKYPGAFMRLRWTFWQFDLCIRSADVRVECSSGEMWNRSWWGSKEKEKRVRAEVKENRNGLKRRDESRGEPVGLDWAVAVGGMWAISIPLMSSVKRQEVSKWMCVCVCVFELCVSVPVCLCMLERRM